eukprot:Skav201865  [mRNA]  locus=scaffold3490:235601:239470:- [translate_table: standard]
MSSDATESFNARSDAQVQREPSQRVRATLVEVIEITLARCQRPVVCLMMLLLLGFMGILIWAELVYSAHEFDSCDQPLALMLRLIFLLVTIQALQRAIARHCLCYDASQDPLIESTATSLSAAALVFPCPAMLLFLINEHIPLLFMYISSWLNSC